MGRSAKKPFSVIKTQSLANIQRSYSPGKNGESSRDSFDIVAEKAVSVSTDITPLGRENERPCHDTADTFVPKSRRRSNTYTRNDSLGKCSVKPEIIPVYSDSNGKRSTAEHTEDNVHPVSSERATPQKATDFETEVVHIDTTTSLCNEQKVCVNSSKGTVLGVPVSELSPIKTDNIDLSSGQDSFCVYEFAADRLSPNSFLHESLLYQKRNSTCLSDLNRACKTPRKSEELGGDCIKVVNSKGFLSPETFLKDLSINKSSFHIKKESFLVDLLSPQSLLNDSIPHEIVVTQLKSIKTRLSDHGLNEAMKNHKKRKSIGKQVAKKDETRIVNKKSNRTNQPVKCKLQNQIPPKITDGANSRRSSILGKKNLKSQTGIDTTHIVSKRLHKESTVIARVQVKSGLVTRKRRSLQQNTEKVSSTKGRKIETSTSQHKHGVVSVEHNHTTFVAKRSQKITMVEQHRLQEVLGLESLSHQRETTEDLECMVDVYDESTTVTETHRQIGLKSKFCNGGSATVIKSSPTHRYVQLKHTSDEPQTCSDLAKIEKSKEQMVEPESIMIEKAVATQCTVNKPLFPVVSNAEVCDDVDVTMEDPMLGLFPLPASPSEIVAAPFENPKSPLNESLMKYTNSNSPFSDPEQGFEHLLNSPGKLSIEEAVTKWPTSLDSHQTTFMLDGSMALPVTGAIDASLGTPELLPTSPNPNTSRRSTHLVAQPKVLDISLVGRKKLFQSNRDGYDFQDILKENLDMSESDCADSVVNDHDNIKLHVPGVGFTNASFGTPDVLPTSPIPDTSRRSTHIVVHPKVIDISHLRRKKLFKSVEDGPIVLDTTGESNASMSASLANDQDSAISSSRPHPRDGTFEMSPTAGTDISLGTSELPTSPNPDTSRRSTHIVSQSKFVDVSHVGRKTLFKSIEETVMNDAEQEVYDETESKLTPDLCFPVEQPSSPKCNSSSGAFVENVNDVDGNAPSLEQVACKEVQLKLTPQPSVQVEPPPSPKFNVASSALVGNVIENVTKTDVPILFSKDDPKDVVSKDICSSHCREMTYACSPSVTKRGMDLRKRGREHSTGRKDVLHKQKMEQDEKRQKHETRQKMTTRQQKPGLYKHDK